MKFLDLDGLNTLKSHIKSTYAKKPKVITSSQLDTCGYESAAALAIAAKNSETGLVFYVSDLFATLYVYGESPVHGCVQVLSGSCLLDDDNLTLITGHTDGQSATYVRTYLNNPATLYNKKAGFDSTTQAWSAWVIRETDVATNNKAAAEINASKLLFGNLANVIFGPNDNKNKLEFKIMYTGGTAIPAGIIGGDIPEASQTCNGLMSVADKIKLDGLSDDGGSTTIDPTAFSKIMRFEEVVTDDVTISTDSMTDSDGVIVYLETKKMFAFRSSDGQYYNNGGAFLTGNYPCIWVNYNDLNNVPFGFVSGYKASPNGIYVDKNYKMYVGGALTSTKTGSTFCNSLNVLNVNNIATNEINVAETE